MGQILEEKVNKCGHVSRPFKNGLFERYLDTCSHENFKNRFFQPLPPGGGRFRPPLRENTEIGIKQKLKHIQECLKGLYLCFHGKRINL